MKAFSQLLPASIGAWIVILHAIVVSSAAYAGPERLNSSLPLEQHFLGPTADHFVDDTGQLGIGDVSTTPSLFTPADGRPANRGVSASSAAALWLRIKLPELDSDSGWVLSIHESRVSRAVLFLPAINGWQSTEWSSRADYAAGRKLVRYPAFHIAGADASERTVYVRIETTSSMRALVWLETDHAYTASYGAQTLAFGALIGAQIALFAYLVALGWALKDGALLRLAALVMAFVIYVAADKAILETMLLPGAFELSRIASLGSSLLIFAAWLAFEGYYLKVQTYLPRLSAVSQAAVMLITFCAVQAVVELVIGIRLIRLYSPYIGLFALGSGVVLALVMMRHEWRRALAFLLCWLPAIGSGVARLSLDASPTISSNPLVVNAVYWGAGFSLLLFGIVVSLDIQARERRLLLAAQSSEARFRSFADSASDSFWETNSDGQLIHLTGQLTGDMVGLPSGTNLVDALREAVREDNQEALAALENAVRERSPFRSIVLAIRGSSDAPRYLAFSGAPSFDQSGNLTGYRGVFTDVSRERLLSDRQMQQRKMAALGQLAGGVAHEINNLLHPIINLTRRVRNSLSPNDERSYQMGIVEDSGVRAQEIVASILATARPAPHSSPIISLSKALVQAIDAVRPIVPAAIEIDLRIKQINGLSLPLGEVLQVISNLVGNAIHAVQGSGRIEVTLDALSSGGAMLCVADNGIGMDATTRERAFEPFFTTKASTGGTGLGLPVIYGIVTGWEASIDIWSEPGRGTRIIITFPDRINSTNGEAHSHAERTTGSDH